VRRGFAYAALDHGEAINHLPGLGIHNHETAIRNRRRPKGWLAPSLRSRLQNVLTWVERLRRFCSVGAISFELVRFDLHLLQNPEIEGLAYQRGTLFGTELRHYLLTKWEYRCAYCSATGIPLEIDHVQPRSKGGSDRVSNLVMACHGCNQAKGDHLLETFLTWAETADIPGRPTPQRLAIFASSTAA